MAFKALYSDLVSIGSGGFSGLIGEGTQNLIRALATSPGLMLTPGEALRFDAVV